jgi:UDP-N-acetylmuramate--alanine ligase
LWNAFLTCFEQAEHVVVLDIYAAREKESLGISAADLAADLASQGHPDARHIADFDDAAEYIVKHVEPEAVVITLSAGDGNQVGQMVLDKINRQ